MLGGIWNIKVGKHEMTIDKLIYTISSTSRLLIEFNLFNVLEREMYLKFKFNCYFQLRKFLESKYLLNTYSFIKISFDTE